MTGTFVAQRSSRNDTGHAKIFIIFVDRIFTVLIEPLFTNVFDTTPQKARIACVWRARHGD
jgi:hypothetical protein